MQNPQFLSIDSQISTKALEKPIIENPKRIFRNLKMNDTSVLRKSIQRPKQTSLPQSPRNFSSFQQQQTTSTLQSSFQNLFRTKRKPSLFQRTMETVYGQDQLSFSITSPKWTEQKSKFSSTLRKFSDLLSSQTIQNRSPRKQSIKGAQQPFDPTRLQTITIKNIQTLQPLLFPRQIKKRKKIIINQSLNLPQIYHVNQQNKKEKQTFYQMHPYFLKKEDTKRLLRRVDKRKNLMALQELFIRLKNKQTSKIYQKK